VWDTQSEETELVGLDAAELVVVDLDAADIAVAGEGASQRLDDLGERHASRWAYLIAGDLGYPIRSTDVPLGAASMRHTVCLQVLYHWRRRERAASLSLRDAQA
jgi:hypothetical protein